MRKVLVFAAAMMVALVMSVAANACDYGVQAVVAPSCGYEQPQAIVQRQVVYAAPVIQRQVVVERQVVKQPVVQRVVQRQVVKRQSFARQTLDSGGVNINAARGAKVKIK